MKKRIYFLKNSRKHFALILIISLYLSVFQSSFSFINATDAEVINYPALSFFNEGSAPLENSPWTFHIRDFSNPSQGILPADRFSDNILTAEATDMSYSLSNNKSSRRIVFNADLTSSVKYGAHLRFAAVQSALYDFGGRIDVINNTSVTGATVYYRIIKKTTSGETTVISGGGTWQYFKVTSAELNPSAVFPVSQTFLESGDSIAIEVYAVSVNGALLNISLGNPTATTVSHSKYNKGTYSNYKYRDYCDNLLFDPEGSNIGTHTSVYGRWNTKILKKDQDAVSYFDIDTMRAQWSIIYNNSVGMGNAAYYYSNNKAQFKNDEGGIAFQFVSPGTGTAQVSLPLTSSTDGIFVRVLVDGSKVYPVQGEWEALKTAASTISAACTVNMDSIISVELYGSAGTSCIINDSVTVNMDAEQYYTETDDIYSGLDSVTYKAFTEMSAEMEFDTQSDTNKTFSDEAAEFIGFLSTYENQKTSCNYLLWDFNATYDGFSAASGSIVSKDNYIRYTNNSGTLLSPNNLRIPASKIIIIELRIKGYYNTSIRINWDNGRSLNSEQSVMLQIPGDEQYHTYQIDLSGNPLWYGYIDRLSLTPDINRPVEIDRLSLSGNAVNVEIPLSGSFRRDVNLLLSVKKDLMQNSNIFKVGFIAGLEYLTAANADGIYSPSTVGQAEYLTALAAETDMPVTMRIMQGEDISADDTCFRWNSDNTVCRRINGGYNSFSLAMTNSNGNKTDCYTRIETLLTQCAGSIRTAINSKPGYIAAVQLNTPDIGECLDYNPDNIREFRDYSMSNFDSLEMFNTEFGTNFASWGLKSTDYDASTVENVGGFDAPRSDENSLFYRSWTDFCDKQIQALINIESEILRQNAVSGITYYNRSGEISFDFSDTEKRSQITGYVETYGDDITAGDVNADFKIDLLDLIRAKKKCVGYEVDYNISALDIDRNKIINANDLSQLKILLLK